MRRTLCVGFISLLAVSALLYADSQVRIVRISFLQHGVETDIPGERWSQALLNSPVIENESLRTSGGGEAEVQFECGSVVRLAPNSEVSFPHLRLRDNGIRATTVSLGHGEMFVTLRRSDSRDFVLELPGGELEPPNSPVALDVRSTVAGQSEIELLDGKASVRIGKQEFALRKQASLSLPAALWVAALPPDQYTQWSHQRDQLFQRDVATSQPSSSIADIGSSLPPTSGLADLAQAVTISQTNAALAKIDSDIGALQIDPTRTPGHRAVPYCAGN
ncbi:MAG TPA: FecR family protein [Terriglobales bacterium]|nr:FecR family protein [Terriglobales bacterium]